MESLELHGILWNPMEFHKIRWANGPKACKTLGAGMLLRILLQLLLHVYLCRVGDPPADKFSMSLGTQVFGVRLFPNSFGLIPELVYLSSEVAWLISETISPF